MNFTQTLTVCIQKNELTSVLEKIRATKNENNGQTKLLNYLTEIYNTLSQNIPGNILNTLCTSLCEQLKDVNPKEKDKYLRVMCFILQYLLKEDLYDSVLQLVPYTSPSWFVESTMLEAHRKIYYNLYALFHNKLNTVFRQQLDTQIIPYLDSMINYSIVFYQVARPMCMTILNISMKFFERLLYCIDVQKSLTQQQVLDIFDNIITTVNTCEITPKNESIMHDVLRIIEIFLYLIPSLIQSTNFLDKIIRFLKKVGLHQYVSFISFMVNAFMFFTDLNSVSCLQIERLQVEFELLTAQLNSELRHLMVYKLVIVCHKFLRRNNNVGSEKSISPEQLHQIIKIFILFGETLAESRIGKCKCTNCGTNRSQAYAVETTVFIFEFVLRTPRLNVETFPLIEQSFKNSMNVIATGFGTNCLERRNVFQRTCLMYYNAIIHISTDIDNTELIIRLGKQLCCETLVYRVFGIAVEEIIRRILKNIGILYTKLRKFECALEPIALYVSLFDDDSLRSCWPTIKSQARAENVNIANITMVQVLRTNGNHLKTMYREFDIDKCDLLRIALYEVEIISTVWPSSECVAAACRTVMDVTDNNQLRAKAFQALWKTTQPPVEYGLDKELSLTIDGLVGKYKSMKPEIDVVLALGNLYCLKYQFLMTSFQELCIGKILAIKVTECDVSNLNQDVDVLLEPPCNINNDIETIQCLDEARKYFEIALNSQYEDIKKKIIEHDSIQYLLTLPLKYKLHGHRLNSIKASILCYKFAEAVTDRSMQFLSLCAIIEFMQFNSEQAQVLISKCQEILIEIGGTEGSQELEIELLISKSVCLYISTNYLEGYKTLVQAETKWKESNSNDEILHCRLNHLRVQYLSLPCNVLEIDNHGNAFMLSIQVMNDLSSLIKNKSIVRASNEFLVITNHLLDYSLYYGGIYSERCLTREARCYLRSHLQFAIQAVLPLRAVQFLCALVYVDYLDLRMEDCEIKTRHISNLLYLQNTSNLETSSPKSVSYQTDSPKDNLKVSKLLDHGDECTCYFCSNITYHHLEFEYKLIQVELTLNLKVDTEKISPKLHFFNEENIDYQFLLQREKRLVESFRFPQYLNVDGICDFRTSLPPIKIQLIIGISRYLVYRTTKSINRKEYTEAARLMDQLFQLLKLCDGSAIHFYNKVIEMRVTILYVTDEAMKIPFKVKKLDQLKVNTPRPVSRNIEEKDEHENEPTLPFTPVKTPALKPKKFFKSRTPGMTAAPIQFKIYTPNVGTKSVRKKMQVDSIIETQRQFQDFDRLRTPNKAMLKPLASEKTVEENLIGCTGKSTGRVAKKKLLVEELEVDSKIKNLDSDVIPTPKPSIRYKKTVQKIKMSETKEQTIDKIDELTVGFDKKMSLSDRISDKNTKFGRTRTKSAAGKSEMSDTSDNNSDDLQSISSSLTDSSIENVNAKCTKSLKLKKTPGKKRIMIVDSSSSMDSSMSLPVEVPKRTVRKSKKAKSPERIISSPKLIEKPRATRKKTAEVAAASVTRTAKNSAPMSTTDKIKLRTKKPKNPFIL